MTTITTKPPHLGPEYDAERWHDVYEPRRIDFIKRQEPHFEIYIGRCLVGCLEARPAYCDRGRFVFKCDLPDIDHQDGFDRYYMSLDRAKLEIISWLHWRLWRARSS